MYNLQEVTAKILNTPPYQLPPVVHHGGVYQLDVNYRGQKLHKVSPILELCLLGYLDFVVRVNDRRTYTHEDHQRMTAPVPLGARVHTRYTTERPTTLLSEKEVPRG